MYVILRQKRTRHFTSRRPRQKTLRLQGMRN